MEGRVGFREMYYYSVYGSTYFTITITRAVTRTVKWTAFREIGIFS